MRRFGSKPAKKSGQNIPKNRCRTTIAEADTGNASGTALYRGSGRLLKPRLGRSQRTRRTRSASEVGQQQLYAAYPGDRPNHVCIAVQLPYPRGSEPSYLGSDRPPRRLRARVMSFGTQIIVPMQLP